ncbi:MAG: hypothetical protein D6748_12245 [Calditrichaeota bacterium]|nr:MAG: hypothetical protein D6748_12245 [Calditrichota bacterium]
MKIQLKIGLLAASPVWEHLLELLGVSYAIPSPRELPDPTKYALLILNRQIGNSEQEAIAHYLREGGSVLAIGDTFATLTQKPVQKKYLRAIIPSHTDQCTFPGLDVIDLFHTVYVCSDAPLLSHTVGFFPYSRGRIGFLGLDPVPLFTNVQALRKSFYATSPRFPNEVVSRVSKGGVIQILRESIKHLFFSRNLPFVHWWYFPEDAPGIFAFRLDSDDASREQVNSFFQLINEFNIKSTWFLHGKAHEGWMDTFLPYQDQGHEFGVHGYRHQVFKDVKRNVQNMEACKKLLLQAGLEVSGFAAPYGSWNSALAKALEETKFLYSSEFSIGYDLYPFYPFVHQHKSSVLQIPIHPICIDSLRHAHASPQQMIDYFQHVIQRLIHSHIPLILYDHPRHEYGQVLKDIFSYVNSLGLLKMTLGEYAQWSSERLRVDFSASLTGDNIEIESRHLTSNRRLAIENAERKISFISTPLKTSLNELKWQTHPREYPYAPLPPQLRQINPRLWWHNLFARYFRWKKSREER